MGTKVDDMPLPVLTSIFRYKIISPFKLSEFIERLKAEIDLFKLLLKKGTKSMTTAATTKTKGITRMTLKKHNFEGYSIRKSKNSVSFQRYVSITTAEGKTKAERVRNAFVDATWKQQELLRTITDRTNLTALGKLKPLAIRALIRQGWTVKVLK